MNIDTSPIRQRPHGDQIALMYQAHVCRDWHDHLKLEQGFNIALINNSLMSRIEEEIWSNTRAEQHSSVSNLVSVIKSFS